MPPLDILTVTAGVVDVEPGFQIYLDAFGTGGTAFTASRIA